MIKNKRLFIILCICVVILLIAAFIIFGQRVKKINVVYLDDSENLNSTPNEIIESCQSILNKNVLTLKDEEVSSLVTNPYVEVLNVETVFPSTIILEVKERVEEYYISYNGDFYVLDSNLLVLRKAAGIVSSDGRNEELIEIKVKDGQVENIKIGEVISFNNNISDLYKSSFNSLVNLFGQASYSDHEYRRLIKSIDIDEHKELTIEFKNQTLNDGCKMTIVIAQADVDGFEKIHTALSVFTELSDLERINGKITVSGSKVNNVYQAVYSK